MEQLRKHLKISSIVVLVFVAVALVNILSGVFLGELNNAEIPADAPDNILLITKIFLLVLSFLLLLPQIYIGLKGLKVAKQPNTSKGHIVWGIILLAFVVMDLIAPLAAIIRQEAVSENVLSIFGILVEITVFFDYVKCAIAVLKATESNK